MSKASKRRPCPALGREITPADCGEQRHSQLKCPVECPHNTFAPAKYSEFLATEARLDAKTVVKLETLAADPAALRREMVRAHQRGVDAANAAYIWQLFFAEDAAQTTVVERWEKSGWDELKNDERVLLRGKMQTRVAVVEVHRIGANGQVEAVDLLSPDPSPFSLQDRSLAAIAGRFSTFLAWIYPLPHYWRLCGTVALIPDVNEFTPTEIVREIVAHLGGPAEEPALRRWLAEHFVRCSDALVAVSYLRHRLMLANIDAKFGRVVYELRAPFAQCRSQLDTLPDIAPDDLTDTELDEGFAEARAWFESRPESTPTVPPGGGTVLGRVLLGQTLWRLEAIGTERLARLRQRFESHLGQSIRFQGERVDDLGARLTAKEPAVDASLVPPRLLENPPQVLLSSSRIPIPPSGLSPKDTEQELMRAADMAFLDDHVPALEHHTPREAARNPELRPKLIRLMKQRVRSTDERNLRSGSRLPTAANDINWLLRELNLEELIFDPPPWRPPPPKPESDEEFPELEDHQEAVAPDPNRPPAPALPAEPWDFEEVERRVRAAGDWFTDIAEVEDELAISGATWLDDLDYLTRDRLTENDFCLALPFLARAWFTFVPPGCRAPGITREALEAAFNLNLRQLELCAEAETPKEMGDFLRKGPQAQLMLYLSALLWKAATTPAKELRPRPESQLVILALLKSLVDELDDALRQK